MQSGNLWVMWTVTKWPCLLNLLLKVTVIGKREWFTNSTVILDSKLPDMKLSIQTEMQQTISQRHLLWIFPSLIWDKSQYLSNKLFPGSIWEWCSPISCNLLNILKNHWPKFIKNQLEGNLQLFCYQMIKVWENYQSIWKQVIEN